LNINHKKLVIGNKKTQTNKAAEHRKKRKEKEQKTAKLESQV